MSQSKKEKLFEIYKNFGFIECENIKELSEFDYNKKLEIDSLELVNLVICLEEEMGINFLDHELIFENFSTLKMINCMVWSKYE